MVARSEIEFARAQTLRSADHLFTPDVAIAGARFAAHSESYSSQRPKTSRTARTSSPYLDGLDITPRAPEEPGPVETVADNDPCAPVDDSRLLVFCS